MIRINLKDRPGIIIRFGLAVLDSELEVLKALRSVFFRKPVERRKSK